MSTLPPYSTFRTDTKQMMYPQAISHGNILTFTPPGFNQELNVKFPDSRLAVCEKCKKNYKTRDMCRVRNNHTEAPWTTAYICITLDDTCTDENSKYIDKPLTVRMVQWQPFCVKKPFDSQHPVCSSCKKTNRTRSFCRERHKHRQLPWCTVYVMLSALDSTDPSTVVADPSKPLDEKEEGETNGNAEKGNKKQEPAEKEEEAPADKAEEEAKEAPPAAAQKEGDVQGEEETGMIDSEFEESDDIKDITESRTFLAKVSYKGMTVHWLDLAEYDPSDAGVPMGFIAPDAMRQASTGVDSNQAQYYAAQAMGYAAQQQAIKTQQQYYYQMRGQQPFPGQAPWPTQYPQEPGAAPAPGAAPVTAGEAAAQQQKQNQNADEGGEQNGAAPQQWPMMFPPQMYQMQPGQYAAAPPQGQQEAAQENGDLGGEMEPAPVGEEGDEGDEGPDVKRIRMV